jgi:hypothetical protein
MILFEGEQADRPYELTRRAFLDVVWNRFAFVEFRHSKMFTGLVYPLPNSKDRYGRTKYVLTIDSKKPPVKQAQTLAHEVIHVDRDVWARYKYFSPNSPTLQWIRSDEENIAHFAAEKFCVDHQPLALKALYHIWLRRVIEKKEKT